VVVVVSEVVVVGIERVRLKAAVPPVVRAVPATVVALRVIV